VESPLTPEQQEKLRRMTIDLRWLVQEGYVTEFGDGRLFAPPPMAETRIKPADSAEGEEHDLESFPEVPAAPAPAAPEAAGQQTATNDAPPATPEAAPAAAEPQVVPPAAKEAVEALDNPPSPSGSDAPAANPPESGAAPTEPAPDDPPKQ
jgi:hypothetical protein